MELNWIDATFGVVLVWSAFWGLWRGLIGGVFGIVSLVMAFLMAQKYGAHLAHPVAVLIGESALSLAMGYVVVFMVGLMVFSALTYFLRKAARKIDLGATDKFGGFLFGVARGGLFALILVVMLSALPMQKAKAWQESLLLPHLGTMVKYAVALPALKEYKQYWQFDSKNRPRLTLPQDITGAAAHSETSQQVQQRDDLLDELNDEFSRQSLHHNEKLTEEVLAAKKKERPSTFLQELKKAMNDIFVKATCAGDECASETPEEK